MKLKNGGSATSRFLECQSTQAPSSSLILRLHNVSVASDSPSSRPRRVHSTMSGARHWEQDKEATVYIGNLDERVSDALVWELMLQAGRIVSSSSIFSTPLRSSGNRCRSMYTSPRTE